MSARHAAQVVLLVLDGLGWEQLRSRASLAPTLAGAEGSERPITSVAPTTTATALTSITTGRRPCEHGILGYRIAMGDEILNVLRWTVGSGRARDARRSVPAREYQPCPPFAGFDGQVPVVSKHEFGGTGFTAVHLGNAPLHGYRVLSSLPLAVGELVRAGEPFVYAYYDGIDKVAHGSGLGELYDAELRGGRPAGRRRRRRTAAGCGPVGHRRSRPARHRIEPRAAGPRAHVGGPVHVRRRALPLAARARRCRGRPRTRWRSSATGPRLGYSRATSSSTRGGSADPSADGLLPRLGDVALVPFTPIAFVDPADTGESRLQSRHGSLTGAEMFVPLLALGGERL